MTLSAAEYDALSFVELDEFRQLVKEATRK